jgi:cell division septation protein DedD
MRVICPKCQFENQADSSRVVCARCATIIDVRPEAGMGYDNYNTNFDPGYSDAGYNDSGYGDSGFDSGRRSTMSTNFAGNYASGNYPSGNYGGGNYPNANYPTAPVSRSGDHDVYATRIDDDDDFGDVLDLPRSAPQQNFQRGETTPVYEDVFSTPDYGMPKEQRNTADPYNSGMSDPYRGHNLNEAGFDSPSYGVPPEPEFMGWPVLPEDSTDPGISNTSNFTKKNSLFKILLMVVGLGVVGLFLYSFLSGPVGKGTRTRPPATDTATIGGDKTGAPDVAATGATDPNKAAAPATVPSNERLPIGVQGPAPITDKGETGQKSSPVVIPPVTSSGKVLQPDKTTTKPPQATTKETTTPKETAGVGATPNRGNITIQVGSFSDQSQANERVSHLQAANVTARMIAANIPGKGTWYRVQVGKFVSREQATGYASQLRGKGLIQDFIVTPIK